MRSSNGGSTVGLDGLLLVLLMGCAAPQTQLAPIPKSAVKAEEEKQRELALEDNQQQQGRLDSLGFPILRKGLALCTHDKGTHLSARFTTRYQYEPLWQPAAAKVLGAGETLTVVGVTPGGAAYNAGIRKGDQILAVGGQSIETGADALKDFSAKIADSKKTDPTRITLTVLNAQARQEHVLQLDQVCDYENIVVQGDDLNAYSDGSTIVMTSTMMRFANDQELQVVYAHEFAHNAMEHIEAKKKNSLFGALIGAIGDIFMATRGVNTGGYYTARGAQEGAMTFSQDFEREADYVGLYAMALADISLTSAPNFWRHMAQADPKSIGLAHTHPTTAERFVRMEQAILEIDGKLARHVALRPEMKGGREQQASDAEPGFALRNQARDVRPTAPAPEARVQSNEGLAVVSPQNIQSTNALTDSSQAYVPYSEPSKNRVVNVGQGTSPSDQPPVNEQATTKSSSSGSPSSRPSVGFTRLPDGTNQVGDARIKRYYPIGCAAQHAIPADQQVFFQSSEGAERDGFVRSGDCQ